MCVCINQQVCSEDYFFASLSFFIYFPIIFFFARKSTVIAIEWFAATILWFALNNATKAPSSNGKEKKTSNKFITKSKPVCSCFVYICSVSSSDSFYLFLFVFFSLVFFVQK